MRVILLGAPGAGKGTQAELICKKYNIPKISTGDMLRAAIAEGTELGFQVKELMASGGLVNDKIIIELVKHRIANSDCKNGFLLDGFPRTLSQAEALLNAGVSIDIVLEIDVTNDEIIKRLSGRRVHLASQRLYHVDFKPPLVDGKDDITGEELIQRDDDKPESIKNRLKIYGEQTKPLTDWYKLSKNKSTGKYIVVDGSLSTTQVSKVIFDKLEELWRKND